MNAIICNKCVRSLAAEQECMYLPVHWMVPFEDRSRCGEMEMDSAGKDSLNNIIEALVHSSEVQNALKALDPDAALTLMNDCGLGPDDGLAADNLTINEISEKHANALRLMYRGS